jgi:hypothetical protein
MIRIAITQAAFDAISATMPLGTVDAAIASYYRGARSADL